MFLIADFISGIIHWLEDTYLYTGIFGGVIDKSVVEPNIYHHKKPAFITQGSYYDTNIVSISLSLFGLVLFTVLSWWIRGMDSMGVYIILSLLSQANQIHKWAHTVNPPKLIKMLQNIGILQSFKHHAKHHQKPYDDKYCILSNLLNPTLDRLNFWRGLEWIISKLGIEPKRGSPLREGY